MELDRTTVIGQVFTGCTECGEEWTEDWERHKPTCSRIDWDKVWADQGGDND